jgi:hypothetical protein
MDTKGRARWLAAISLLLLLAAASTPAVLAWRHALETDYDSPPGWVSGFYGAALVLLLAIFAPSMTITVRYSPDVRALATSTLVVAAFMLGAHAFVQLADSDAGLLAFPVSGLAAALAASRVVPQRPRTHQQTHTPTRYEEPPFR